MQFTWSSTKNEWLKKERDISFEEILIHIDHGCLVDVVDHPNQSKYPRQRIFLVNVHGYIYLVPFEELVNQIELKTIIPSRKATKRYRKGAKGHEGTE